ncbi:MAG: hypothetical protein MZV70_20130 [Desulfobacterales bacterium]|nr:hypothetical protein [Desulfobacterales bacterium]
MLALWILAAVRVDRRAARSTPGCGCSACGSDMRSPRLNQGAAAPDRASGQPQGGARPAESAPAHHPRSRRKSWG